MNKKIKRINSFSEKKKRYTAKELEFLENKTHIEKSHLEKILNYAIDNNQIIAIRDLNQNIPQKIKEENLTIGKDLHIKFKSATRTEIGGFIPVDNRFSKKYDPGANEKMLKLLEDPNSNYKAINVVKAVRENNQEINYTLCFNDNDDKNPVIFYRNEKNGQYYSVLKNGEELFFDKNIPIKEILILADKEGHKIIPDYDLATIGNEIINIDSHAELDKNFGRIPIKDRKIINDLELVTNKMVRHGADNYNPVGYDFEMSEESPYTSFTPDGKIHMSHNPSSYLKILNKWRDEGYNLTLNPKLGIECKENGYLYLPPENEKFDWKNMDNKISDLKKSNDNLKVSLFNEQIKKIEIFLPAKLSEELKNNPEKNIKNVQNYLKKKIEFNETISENFERLKRTEMQKIFYKNKPQDEKDAYFESVANLRDGIRHMEEIYRKELGSPSIFSEISENYPKNPLIKETQVVEELVGKIGKNFAQSFNLENNLPDKDNNLSNNFHKPKSRAH